MIVVIPRTDPQCNPDQEPDWEWLPRVCPACEQAAIVGHGRRWKQAHAPGCTRILIRRAICKLCQKTCTVLPAWSLPSTHYSVETRQQSWDRQREGESVMDAAPVLQDPDHSPDESTLRRWLRRRIEALGSGLVLARSWQTLLWRPVPTILAWDFRAALRILIPEKKRDAISPNGP
jgi:hypothetical protein